MNLDFFIGVLIGILIIFVILLTLPIWICIITIKKINVKFIKYIYILWLKK